MAYQPEIEKLEQRYAAEPARNFAQLAEAYRRDGRLDQALDLLHMHLQDRPDYVSGLVVLGRCLVEKQEDTEAQETFEHVLMLDAEHIIALKALADISGRADDTDGARNWLQRLLDVDPMNEDAQAGLEALAAADQEPGKPPLPETVAEMEPVSAPEAEPEPEPEPPAIPPTVAFPAVDVLAPTDAPAEVSADAEPAESEELVIERASAEYDVVAADLEPVDLEQSSEAALPPLPDAPAAEPESEEDLDATAPMFASEPEPSGAGPEEGDSILKESPPGDLDLEPFDSNLGWGTGERVSRQITSEDIAAAERAHEETLEDAAVQELPGMEDADVPQVGQEADEGVTLETTATTPDVDAEPVTGLEPEEFETVDSGAATPLEGLEPTSEDASFGTGATPTPTPTPTPPSPELGTEGIVTYDSAETVRLEGIDAPAPEPVSDLGLPAAEEETVWVEPEEPTPEEEPSTPVAESAPANEEAAAVADEVDEPVPVDEAPSEDEGERREGERRSSLDGLPVFMPDEEEEEEPAPAGEPEPVVTETMAEVYAKQGLIDEARDVYRKLLDVRPDDARLQDRLAELDAQPAAGVGLGPKADRYSAAAIGGESARSFLRSILSGHVGESPSAPAADVVPAEEATPAPMPAPAPIDEAFEGDDEDTVPGAPTQPAADEMTLANVFGDAPAPVAQAEPETPAGAAGGGGAPGGFSFDEFFGSRPGQRPSTGEHRPPRDTMADDEGDEAFRNWLKGLKG